MGVGSSLIAGGASILGNVFGGLAGNDANAEANAMQQLLLEEMDKLPSELPDAEKMKLILESNPELYQLPEEVKYQLIQEAPQMRNMQVEALNNMDALAREGMDTEMKREYEKARRLSETTAKGREDAIIADMQRRGMSGSGLEMVARQQAGQSAADRAAESANEQASQNAQLKALMNEAKLRGAGDVRAADFKTTSSNTDIINRFNELNSKNKMAIRNANTELRNKTAAANTQAERETAKYNTETANRRQELANQNTYDKARLKANVMGGSINRQDAQSAANSDMARSIFETAGKVGGSIYDNATSTPSNTYVPQDTSTNPYDNYQWSPEYKGYSPSYSFYNK